MPWFVASRPVVTKVTKGRPSEKNEYRVFSESQIDAIGPEWDWASSACDSQEEAQQRADDLFWDADD